MTLKDLITVLKSSTSMEDIDVHREEIIELIPQVKIMIGYDQCNRTHQYDLWYHSLKTVIGLPKDIDDDMVYLAALLHDIGKPDCRIEDEKDGKPNMHYYGHPERSVEIVVDSVLPTLIAKGETLSFDEQRILQYYILYHDDHVSCKVKHLRRHLNNLKVTLDQFKNLMKLQVADAKAHIIFPFIQERIDICEKLAGDYSDILYKKILGECVNIETDIYLVEREVKE